MTYPDGYRYEGAWQAGQRHGEGVAIYADGAIYEGAFANGQRHGQGKLTMPAGFTYIGDWSRGEITGEGSATYANGDVYKGAFVKGTRQGQGTMTYATGEVASGNWINGALAEVPRPSQKPTQAPLRKRSRKMPGKRWTPRQKGHQTDTSPRRVVFKRSAAHPVCLRVPARTGHHIRQHERRR